MLDDLSIFACPGCGGDLSAAENAVQCGNCGQAYPVEDAIVRLFWPNEWDASKEDVTEIVKAFYEETPFPDYENLETSGDLLTKAGAGHFARLLDEQIPNVRVLEIGCGTGQLSNFLGIGQRVAYGADLCMNSLRLAEAFRARNTLTRVGFYQMNLFRPPFREETFPLVICNGVLHHTSDPYGGFRSISRPVKKGGYIIVGLYNLVRSSAHRCSSKDLRCFRRSLPVP